MVVDNVEHPLGVVYRFRGTRRPHWLIISGRAIDPLTTTVLNKSKFPSDTESNWLVFLEWPYNFSWRIFIILNIYMTILLTVMMGTTLVDLIILIVIQHILSLFFLIDFLLAVLHRIIYLPAKVLTCKRSYLCLVIEAISMLPLAVLYMIIVPNYEQDMVFFLSCIVGLRFYRIHQFFNEESYAAGVAHIKFTILKFSLYFFLTNFIFAMLWMRSFFASLSNDFWQIWEDKHGSLLLTALYFALMTFTNTGYGDIRAKTTPDKIACTIAMLVGFILVTGVLIGSLTKDLLQREEPREKYRREFHSTVRYLKEHSLGPNTVKKIMEEMNTLWNYKKGVTDHVTENLLPIPLRKEISFDIVFGFLYRSILFANQDRTFLRSISLIMRNKTYLPGDEIVRPTGILHGMICVTSGIVEILSVENDSSPIISFTAGTVLGEISLFLAIPIKIIIRASTIVELQVLDAMDFYRLAMKFTSNCSAMRADIIKRCKESRKILLNDETKSLDPEEPANLRLKTLKELIKNLKTSPNPGDVESTKLDAFKANITNLYVIMENLPKVKVLPLTLMRNKPWILRPDTPLTYTWDVLMFIVVSFVLIYYPYVAAFYRQIDTFGYMVLFSVEIVYIVDLFKQCITAVPRDDLFSYKTEVKEIVLTRLRSYGFYLDVLSTYELSVFTPLFNFGTRDHMLLILSLNKMLRFWIVPRLFDTMENQFTRSLLFIRIIKYIYYVFLAVHNAASFLYLEACPSHCYADRWFHFFHANRLDEGKHQPTVLHPYIISVYLAVMLTSTTGYGNILPASDEDMVTMMVLMILGLITFTFVISQLSGTLKHIERKKTQYQEEIYAIDRFLKEHNMPQQLRERMRRYFRVQWSYDRGRSFHRTIEINQLPKKLRTIMLNEKLTTLQSVPIFKHAHPGFMLELAKGCQVRVLPDKEMVVYAGSLDREMYILQSGYCTMHNKNRPGEFSVIGAYTSFGDLEMIQGVPIVLDVKTLTHVRIICIEYATYMRAVTKYPDVSRHIEQMMKTTKITASSIDLSRITVTEKRTRHMFQPTVWQRFWTCLKDAFINVYKYDKRHNRDYWEPFQNWNKLSFLRYIFLPIVLKPDSTVLRVWMTIRVLACIFVGFLAPIYFTLPALMMKITGWILMFQFIIWIDLYLTFHLAYYDQKGVLIFHPAKTVPHYIKGSFFLDLIISFPYFTLVRRWIADHRPSFVYNGCGLIKVLQYYKFLQVCNAYETDILRRSASLKLLKYLPTILIVTNLLAAMLILIECQSLEYRETLFDLSTHGSYRAAIQEHCSRPLGSNQDMDFEMYLIAYYYITASMTSCGFGDVIPTNNTNVVACVFTIMFGVFIYGSMFASIAGSKIFAYYNVTIYRTQMREMMTFLGKGNVSEKLKRRIFMHYLQTWGRTYGYTPQKTLSNVHTVLKQDIVDWMYESTLRKVAVFNFVDKYFIRCVGKYIDEIYFLEGEEICKHNHLQDEIYIIYRGKIDILDEEGNHITSMGGGGLFGNMTNKSTALSAITAVAATNVELIRMKSDDFHKTLVIYPNIKKEIVRLTSLSPDYISPTAEMDYITVDNVEIDSPSFPDIYVHPGSNFPQSRNMNGSLYFQRAIYRPDGTSKMNFLIVYGSWLHTGIAILTNFFSYLSCMTVTYVFAFQDYREMILIPYIIPDIYFYIKILAELNITYIDSRNDHICGRKHIIRKYVKSWRFYFDIFSSLPVELFAFAATPTTFLVAMSFLRLNRILRFYYFIEYYKSGINRLMVNIYVLEIGTLLAWTSILIHCLACVWYLCACPVFFCLDESWVTHARAQNADVLDKYITSLYYIVTIITTTGYGDIVPVTNVELVVTTLIMILSHFGLVLGAVTFLAMINVTSLTFVSYEESISQYKKDLIRQKISPYQLTKLWKYVQLLWWRELGKQIPLFIHSAPYIMKCDIYIALYGNHLERSYVFSSLDATFQRQLAIYLRRYIFFPGYYIVQQGDKDGTMYFIHRGEVSVMTIHTDLMETVHYHLRTNDQFGIAQGLIFGEPHVFSYRAETEVEIISLQLSHWQHLLKYFPKIKPLIYERLHKLQND